MNRWTSKGKVKPMTCFNSKFILGFWGWNPLIFLTWGVPALPIYEDEKPFSGELRIEGGSFQAPGDDLSAYQISRLELESHLDATPNLSIALEGQAEWQASTASAPPPEPEFLVGNLIPVEISNSNGPFYSFELYQASLHFTSGRLDVTGGLFKPFWGSSHFYRPTDYFFPVQPLQWLKDPPGIQRQPGRHFLFVRRFEPGGRWPFIGRGGRGMGPAAGEQRHRYHGDTQLRQFAGAKRARGGIVRDFPRFPNEVGRRGLAVSGRHRPG